MSLDRAAELIRGFESCRLTAYPDPKSPRGAKLAKLKIDDPTLDGKPWTIGWGCTGRMSDGRRIEEGLVIAQDEADNELAHRLFAVDQVLEPAIKVPITDSQRAAILSLAWNVGESNLPGSHLFQFLNAGDYGAAARAFLSWDHARGVVDAELLQRRTDEMNVFLEDSRRTTPTT